MEGELLVGKSGPRMENVCEGDVGVGASDDVPPEGGGEETNEEGKSRPSCCHNVLDHQSGM